MVKAMNLGGWASRNWFLPVLALLLGIEFAFARATDWSRDGVAEAVILFDMCLFVPALYALCHRRRVALRPLLIRTFALAVLGVYIASKLVPPEAQHLVAELSWARMAGWVVLAAIELWVVVKVARLTFGGSVTAEQIAERHGTPEWIARLMLLEARFWKAVWRLVRGR